MYSFEGSLASWIVLLARICLAAVFLVSGVHKAIWYGRAVEEFREARAPFIAITLPATIVLHIVAQICLIIGIYTAEAAVGLAVFTVLATERQFAFWRFEGTERLVRSRIALANLAVIGGLLLLALVGPGPLVPG